MNTPHSTPINWRDLADNLTPAQVRHLGAIERLALENIDSADARTQATAREVLDNLPAEAAWNVSRNAQPGDGAH